MDAKQWQEVKRVFAAALEESPDDLDLFVARECGSDETVRAEVTRLLTSHATAGEFLQGEPRTAPAGLTAATQTGPQPPPLAGSRFDIVTKLGAGSFGDVFEAFDRSQKCHVALKYLRDFEPEQLYRLKREFRTLSDIRHPNLVHVFELFSSNVPAFFTMELLKGRDFGRLLHDAAPEPGATPDGSRFHRTRSYLTQLCQGIIALHDAHLIHRDIKPSNVFVTDDDRVVLLDFGLVKQLEPMTSASTLALAGTPDYAAPEQLEYLELSPAADWYAFGTLLFEALTGHKPFEGGLRQVLEGKRTTDPPRASSRAASVPADLDDLCHRLLQRDPAARPTGTEILRALDAGTAALSASRPTSHGPKLRAFVGREPDLAELRVAFDEMARGLTACVHIRGASGTGKTALVRSFVETVRRDTPGCVVLHGRCYDSDAAPHRGLDELVDRLALFLRGLDSHVIQSFLPRHFNLLARLFPVLQQFQPTRNAPEVADPREQRQRALDCLRECLRRISESHLLILWIDDLQWCDEDTVRMLNGLVQALDPFGCLLLLSYRDTDIDQSPSLTALQPTAQALPRGTSIRTLIIRNLSFDAARDLALTLLTADGASQDWSATADVVARESGGNPFFLTELARYAGDAPQDQQVAAGAFGIAHVIRRRAGRLPGQALRLLELVAVAGQPVAATLCVEAAAIAEHYLESRTALIRAHLLQAKQTAAGEQLDVYHDQIREAIVGALSAEATVAYHRLIAEALERAEHPDHEQLSVHYEAAGHLDRAATASLHAANAAEQGLAFDRAARLYARVLALRGEGTPGNEAIAERLGGALSNAGRGKEAAEAFLRASETVAPDRRLDLRRRACEQYLRSGHTDSGVALMRSLLEEAGMWFPKTSATVLCSLLWHRLRLRLLLWRAAGRPTRPSTDTERMRLDVSRTCAIGMSMVDSLRGADFQARNTLLAVRTADPARRAAGLAGELGLGGVNGRRSLAKTGRLFAWAMAAATESGNTTAVVFTTQMSGVASFTAGHFAESLEKSNLAASRYAEECSGVDWELTTTQSFALLALYLLGRWHEHAERLPRIVRHADARGNRYGAIALPLVTHSYIASLVTDEPDSAHASIERGLSAWTYTTFQSHHYAALVGHGEAHLYVGDGARALEAIDAQWSAVKRSHLLRVLYRNVQMRSLRGRASLSAARRVTGAERARLLNQARREAHQLLRLRQPWALALGHLLEAGVSSFGGDTSETEGYLRRSENLFVSAEMSQYVAAARWRLAQIRPSLAAEQAEADRWMADQGVKRPDRIADMLAPGLWINSGQIQDG